MKARAGLLLAWLAACTTDETGTLSLLPPLSDASRDGGAPPACSVPGDCPDEQPFCSSGRCAECALDGDCSSGSQPRCSSELALCVECLSNTDCDDSDRVLCDGTRGTCVECLSDVDCTETDRPGCLIAEGRCEPCSRDEHCPEGQLCSIAEGQCR